MRNNTILGRRCQPCGSIFWTLDTSFISWITFTLPLSSTRHHCLVLWYVTLLDHLMYRAPVLLCVSQRHDFECVLVLTWSTAPVRRFQSLRAQGCRTSGCGLEAYLAMPRSLHEEQHVANCFAADPAMVPRWRLALLWTKPCVRQMNLSNVVFSLNCCDVSFKWSRVDRAFC